MKTSKRMILATLLTLMLTICSAASAQSLWGQGTDVGGYGMVSDRKARDVGDILTIVIRESTTQQTSKSTSNSKSGNTELGAGLGIFDFFRAASISGSDNFKADGSANASNSVSGQVSVTVVDVMKNGNMVVEGTQSIWQNKNEHKITIRGIVRRDDVTPANTVPSTKVADATLRFDGKGPLNAKQRQGILTQIFNFLF